MTLVLPQSLAAKTNDQPAPLPIPSNLLAETVLPAAPELASVASNEIHKPLPWRPKNRIELALRLKENFLEFAMYFYFAMFKRPFVITQPAGRESHVITIARGYVEVIQGKHKYYMINVPPRHGKSTISILWLCWIFAKFPMSNNLYISSAKHLAEKHSSIVKQIIELPEFGDLFGVYLRKDSRAKTSFKTNYGGALEAFGAEGGITGQDAGIPFVDYFGGVTLIDDIHKAHEVHSKAIVESISTIYDETIKPRSMYCPTVYIGHILSQNDVPSRMLAGKYGEKWHRVSIPALDKLDNALCPGIIAAQELVEMRQFSPYKFFSQYQQDPILGSAQLFRREYFPVLDVEPEILCTFVVTDTAESTKTYADFTVFSFFGVYQIKTAFSTEPVYGIHWLNTKEIRVEPHELLEMFTMFLRECQTFPIPPAFIACEKMVTGVTLASQLGQWQGLEVIPLMRKVAKGERFIQAQEFIAKRKVSFPRYAPHYLNCIEHMSKINPDCTHAHDDICDTVVDAVDLVRSHYFANKYLPKVPKYKPEEVEKLIFMPDRREETNLWSL